MKKKTRDGIQFQLKLIVDLSLILMFFKILLISENLVKIYFFLVVRFGTWIRFGELSTVSLRHSKKDGVWKVTLYYQDESTEKLNKKRHFLKLKKIKIKRRENLYPRTGVKFLLEYGKLHKWELLFLLTVFCKKLRSYPKNGLNMPLQGLNPLFAILGLLFKNLLSF